MNRLHASGWLLLLLALIAGGLWMRHQGVASERAKVVADSLTAQNAVLKQASQQALAGVDSAKLREGLALQQERGREQALRASQGSLDSLRGILARSLDGSQKLALDSLEALHAQREDTLRAERDTYRALFLAAAGQRDTVVSLLRASQAQIGGLQAALVQARKRPLWDSPAIQITEKALAIYGLVRLVNP